MISGNLSKEKIKRQIEDIRYKRKLSEFERIKAIRKQYAEELSVIHDAMDSSVSGIIICNPEGKIIYVNNTFLRIFEYQTKAEVLGKNAADLFVEENIKKLSDVKAIIDKAKGDVKEFAVRRKDGNTFPVEVSSSNVTDGSGKIVGNMASFFDISKRKKAEEEKRKLETRLNEAKRLEFISTQAVGLAQKINTALKELIENMNRLQMDLGHDDVMKGRIREIEKVTSKIGHLTQELAVIEKQEKIS